MLSLSGDRVNFAKDRDKKLDFSSFIQINLCFGPKLNFGHKNVVYAGTVEFLTDMIPEIEFL